MPSNIVKSFADKTGKSESEVESAWEKAKKISVEDKGLEDYPYIVGILKNMLGIKEQVMTANFMEFLKSDKKAKEFINECVKIKEAEDDEINNVDFVEQEGFWEYLRRTKQKPNGTIPDQKRLWASFQKIWSKLNTKEKHEYVYGPSSFRQYESCKTEDAQVSGSLGNVVTSPVGMTKSKDLETKDESIDGDVNPATDVPFSKDGQEVIEANDGGGEDGTIMAQKSIDDKRDIVSEDNVLLDIQKELDNIRNDKMVDSMAYFFGEIPLFSEKLDQLTKNNNQLKIYVQKELNKIYNYKRKY